MELTNVVQVFIYSNLYSLRLFVFTGLTTEVECLFEPPLDYLPMNRPLIALARHPLILLTQPLTHNFSKLPISLNLIKDWLFG